MKLLKRMGLRYTIYCPNCNQELFLDGRTISNDFLACKNKDCMMYYQINRKSKKLQENGSYQAVLDDLKEKGLSISHVIPSSIAYKPKYIKILELLFKK